MDSLVLADDEYTQFGVVELCEDGEMLEEYEMLEEAEIVSGMKVSG